MSTSKIIRSIKSNTQDWMVIERKDYGVAFAYKPNPNWIFINIFNNNSKAGFVLKTLDGNVYMRWTKEDAVAKQLWSCLVNVFIDSL